MNTAPLKAVTFIQDKLVVPVTRFRERYISRAGLYNGCQKIANFIFNRSKETALIMLVFNAISVLSSHYSQMRGLRKSNRENKDYLIKQEKTEMYLDCLLTIVPPFLLNNALKKKFDSGQWTTRSSLEKMVDTVAPYVGAQKKELYNTDHIVPVWETIKDGVKTLIKSLKDNHKLPKFISDRINVTAVDPNKKVPAATMPQILKDFDKRAKGKVDGFYNKSAYDDIWGQRNGLLIMATIGYTIIASNIIMPILKNKISNYFYNKQLKEQGETPESIKRKKRYNTLMEFPKDDSDTSGNIFNIFSNSNNTITTTPYTGVVDTSVYKDLLTAVPDKKIFGEISTFTSGSNGLKI